MSQNAGVNFLVNVSAAFLVAAVVFVIGTYSFIVPQLLAEKVDTHVVERKISAMEAEIASLRKHVGIQQAQLKRLLARQAAAEKSEESEQSYSEAGVE